MRTKPSEITLNFIQDIIKREGRVADFLGHKIIINKKVFPVDSPFSYSSKITAKRLRPKKDDVVLDIGTGTGVQAIIAAKRGAKRVVAVDIDKNSLENARQNVKFHKLVKVIEIRKSDLFSNIGPDEKFDIIVSQLPFANVDYKHKISHFLFDPGFKLHTRLMKDAKKHLTNKGKLFIPSSQIADEKRLLKLIKKYDYKILKIEKERYAGIIWKLYVLGLNSN